MFNIFFWIICVILIGHLVLDFIAERLNIKTLSPTLPPGFDGYYDHDKYAQSQHYLADNTFLHLFESVVSTLIMIFLMASATFNVVDGWCRSFGFGPIGTGLLFCGALGLAVFLFNIPFSIYQTFVIEERYGFNRTTKKTFILDKIKNLILGTIILGLLLSGILYFFEKAGVMACLYSWIAITLFQIILIYIAPNLIMPLFNKFTPLKNDELKIAITKYAKEQKFALKGIYTMDGSKRSSKGNAFFTGFGASRRIVLFDTLIEKLTNEEILAVLAHEIGHYKHKHVFKLFTISTINMAIMLFLLSFFLDNRALFNAFQMQHTSTYASLIFFGILYTPIQTVMSIFALRLSRKYEYEADQYAVTTTKENIALIVALKKLSVDHLANLTPHWLKVALSYNHPPVLDRIKNIQN